MRTNAKDGFLARRQGPVLDLLAGHEAGSSKERRQNVPLFRYCSVLTATLNVLRVDGARLRRVRTACGDGIQLLVARIGRSEGTQNHLGRPIIVRCIPTVPTRRIALWRDARPECLMTTRTRFFLTGTTVSIMVRNRRRERR